MLTLAEKVLFVLAAGASAALTLRSVDRIRRAIRRGSGEFRPRQIPRRLFETVFLTLSQWTTFKTRRRPGLAHILVVWGFSYYVLVNLGDVLEGFLPGWVFLGQGWVGHVYRLGGDLLSVAILAGMLALLVRRLLFGSRIFSFLESTRLDPKARGGILRDSIVVAGFILLHVGWRFLGQSFALAMVGRDPWQPFASQVSLLWRGASLGTLVLMRHISFWMALGLVLVFLPYFAVSKHIHIFFAPLNFLIKPQHLAEVGGQAQAGKGRRRPVSLLARINFEDESIVQYGAARLEHLPWPLIQDAYACIQCNRCQDVCPANATGKSLSPSALEINKRYLLNREAATLASGKESSAPLLDFAISEEALWACTTCGACVEICPVKDEPMLDILQIRRNQVLTENVFPDQLQNAFRGMERQANPWGLAPEHRLDWAKGLPVPTIDENPQPEILWWVGCAPATEPRAQRTAREFVRILQAAGVNYAVLGTRERCTGDSARRSGNEYLFSQLAQENAQTLNAVKPQRIVTTCPHCLHTLANEYPQFGARYPVIHHSQLIQELISDGRLKLRPKALERVAFHDPCYLGRHNGIIEEPRRLLSEAGMELHELPRNRSRSFCCGAGGAQMWKEEEPGRERVSANRFREVESSGADTLAVACPFCMIMLSDASRAAGEKIPVRDVAEIVGQALPSRWEAGPAGRGAASGRRVRSSGAHSP